MDLVAAPDPFESSQGNSGGLTPVSDPFSGEAPQQTENAPAKTVKFDVGGVEIEMPDVPDEQRSEILSKFRETPEFDALIDREAGASMWARTLVGSAPEQDRLANLKQIYPDAVPYGDDNFVFTNPETGKPTLYNPPGLDFGDVPAVAREATQAVGAGFGATMAGGSALLTTGPAAPLTVPTAAAIGAGFGSETGAALFDAAFSLLSPRIDTRTVGETAADTAMGFMSAASGQKMGDMAGPLIAAGSRSIIGGTKAASEKLVQSFMNLRIDPPAGAVSSSRAVQTVEKMLESSPVSASIMQEQAEKVLSQTKSAAEQLAREFGAVKTKQGAGATIKQAAVKAAERFGFQQEKLYDEAFDAIGKDWIVRPDALRGLRSEMQVELDRAPNSLKAVLTPAIKKVDAILLDADAGLPFDALRQIRTMIGKDLATPMLTGSSGSHNAAMKRIYGALTEDMSATAKAAGSDAAKALEKADRYTRMFMNTSAKTMEKIAKFDADERAYDFALQASRDGGSGLARLRRNFEPEEWDTIAGTVLGRMGLSRAGAQNASGDAFSVNTFLTNWNKMAPEAKTALFGGNRYKDLAPALDDLVAVVGSLKDAERLANSSNTGRTLIAFTQMSVLSGALGGLGGLLAGGDATSGGLGGAGSVIGTIVAPRVAAKLITEPKFVRWLADQASQTSVRFGRLVGVMADEPGMQDAVQAYIEALAGNTELMGPAAP